MSGPAKEDRQLSEFWRRLLVAVVDPQQFSAAMNALAEFFEASSAHLLKSLPLPSEDFIAGSVHAFDCGADQAWLAQARPGATAGHGLCAVVRHTPRHFDAIVVLRNGAAFDEGETSWMEMLLAQIRFALDLRDTLSSPLPTAPVAAQLAKIFPMPCILTDEWGRCIERNDAFRNLLEVLSGSLRGGRVVFDDPFLQGSWRQALMEGHANTAAQSLLATAPTGDQWKVHIVPFACIDSYAHATPRQLMYAFFEKFAGTAQTKTVPASRPLTKAELEVLANLMLGQTAKVIARARGASVNTVRSQITAILAKTGHHTQKELIAALNTGALAAMVPKYEAEPRGMSS
ncbi:MAG TPA: helix-turn-helix transcriptional regulator [Ramlibacter sp.]|nr:helix-turn-helix transcriptional regulator [Ramlibacter sp.]